MSSRAVRRIQEGATAQGLPLGPCAEVSPSSSDTESESENAKKSPKKVAKAKGNLFDLLQDDQSGKSDQASPSESESPEEVERAVRPKKQNRKGKKSKVKATAASPPSDPSDDDDLDFLSRELEALDASSLPAEASNLKAQSGSDTVINRLFSIKAKNLNPDNELRRVLGLEVGQASKRKPGRDHRAHSLRTQYILVQPKQFPQAKDSGLSMRLKNTDAGVQYFVFSHSGKYAEAQRQFYMMAKVTTDPEGFYYILHKCQHHVDSLLQLSELMRQGGHAQEASDMLQRVIYILESAFHPNFNVCNGKVRLEYKHQVNRAFFIALFRYIATIAGRACHGTALEFCKLMYNIDPADPLAVLLFVDFYAVRSQQYDWLISLYEEWNKTRNLNLLPNFAFSVALAYFKKGNIAQADNLLQHGLTLFPTVLLPLLNKCSIDADMGVVSHEFFMDAERKSNSNVKLLTSLYVERSHMLWKDASLLPWLERNARVVLASVDSKDQRVADLLDKRAKCFVGTPLNIYRHAILSDLPDTLKHIPHEISSKGWVSFDPLPPDDSIVSYRPEEISEVLREIQNFRRHINHHFEREVEDPREID